MPLSILRFETLEDALSAVESVALEDQKIVLDIDDTVLFRAGNRSRRIEPVYRLYLRMLQRKCRIYFVTARLATPECEGSTRRALERLGFGTYERLFCNTHGSQLPDVVAAFKHEARKTIGYPIALNIGNAWQDLLGPELLLKSNPSQPVVAANGPVYVFSGIGEKVNLCVKLPRKFLPPEKTSLV